MRAINLATIFLIISSTNLHANIGDDMGKFWDSLGGTSNISDPRFVKNQKAGYMSLGGIQMRSNVENFQLASMQLPSIRSGCGGIDFYAGGFSFISSDQLQALGKSIASNAPGALAQLALDNISPQLGSIVKYFQNVAREVNELNINSCTAAKNIIGNPGGVYNAAKTQACTLWGRSSGKFQDAASAQEQCTSGGQASTASSDAPNAMQDQFKLSNINIAWKALTDAGYVDLSNPDSIALAEIFMTLSGTMIISGGNGDNAETTVESFFPEMNKGKTITSLLSGGSLKVLRCEDKNDCLSVNEETVTISQENSYLGKVGGAIEEMFEAIKNDSNSNLSDNSTKLLSFSSIPIYKILNVHASYYQNTVDLGSVSEFMALEILYGYLDNINRETRKASSKYNKEPHNTVFKSFFRNQELSTQYLDIKRAALSDKFNDYMNLLNRTITVEKSLQKTINKKMAINKS